MGITVFNFNAHEVRTLIKDGEPWFVAKDVCDVLEIQNVTQALETPEEILARALIVAKETIDRVSRKVTGKGQIYFVNKFLQAQQVA